MQKAAELSSVARFPALLRKLSPLRLAHAHEREAFFVAAVGAAAFYLTALGSFTPFDASWVTASYPTVAPYNLAGTLGADLSGLAFFAFGLVAWLLPLPLLTSATLVLRRSETALAHSRTLGWLLALASIAALAALQKPEVSWHGFAIPSGGVIGSLLAEQLVLWLGHVGSLIVIATIALCAGLMICRRSLFSPVYRLVQSSTRLRPPLWWDKILHRSPSETAASTSQDKTLKDEAAHACEPLVEAIPGETHIADEKSEAPLAMLTPIEEEPPLFATTLPTLVPAVPRAVDRPREKSQPPAYTPPPLSVFNRTDAPVATAVNQRELETTAALLVKTFEDFGVLGKVIGYQPGPVVTVFEFQPDAGVKQSKVVGLIDDLALALKVDSIFIHPVRGKRALGVQVPNTKREPVHLGDILATTAFRDSPAPLTFGLGKTINGQPMCADLTAMPHLLVAGATGSGKSVCINGMLCSIIMKASPEDVRMVLVDPKMLELSVYEGIPHLLMPVITEPTRASLALKWATSEMERRYKLMQLACVRNIAGFNEFWTKATTGRQDQIREAMADESLGRLPYILLVIDELADLMMTAPKDVEGSIQRLAQKARASGIHMVLATQRPSVDIITGVIKANLPCRVAFQVVSKHDSRTILDLIGAEKLLGKGDMLLQRPGIGRLERLQGALITDEEVLNLVASVKAASPVQYDETIINWIDEEFARQKDGGKDDGELDLAMDDDPKFEEAVVLARAHGVVSASFLQRHLKIGYNRAARIVEFMEAKGLVDRADGAKPRKWLGPMGASG